jgi:hypothetical protein
MKATVSLFAALAISAAATGSQAFASPMRGPPASPCATFVALDPATDGAEYEEFAKQARPDWPANLPSPQPSPPGRGSPAAAVAAPFPLLEGEGQGEGLRRRLISLSHRRSVAPLVNELKPESASASLASRDASGVAIVRNPFFEASPPAH